MSRIARSLDQLRHDLRYSARSLRRGPGFAFAAVFSLAIGIGATTAVFSAVDRILFQPLPYPFGDRIVSLGLSTPAMPYDFFFGAGYLEFRETQELFDSVTSWSGVADCDLTDGEPVRFSCAQVETSFLETLGVVPILGRSFTRDEDSPDAPKTVILSDAVWRSRFVGRSDIVGSVISLDGQPARVVGVLPGNFEMPTLAAADMLVPQALDDATLRRAVSGRPLRVLARFPPGMPATAAAALMNSLNRSNLSGVPAGLAKEVRFRVRPLRDLHLGDAYLASWALLGSVIVLLLLTCANVANLFLSRTLSRTRELAIRSALGASRSRLARQALTDSLLIAFTGGAAGIAAAYVLLRIFAAMAPEGIPLLLDASLDHRVLIFTTCTSVACGLLFGVSSAFARPVHASTVALRSRRRQTFVAVQVALSLALVSAATLLVKAFWTYQNSPLGMEADHVTTASLTLSRHRYPTPASQLAFYEELESRLQTLPGVLSAAVSDSMPPYVPARSRPMVALQVQGQNGAPAAAGTVVWRSVTPDYFRTLGIPIRRGRGFAQGDRLPGRRVMILSETLARRLFPQQDPLGKIVSGFEVIGVTGDVRNGGAGLDDPEYYLPRSRDSADSIYNYPNALRHGSLLLRSPLDTATLARMVRTEIAGLDPQLPASIETMEQHKAKLATRPRFNAALFSLFAAIGLFLSACGLYGVASFVRTAMVREIAVRMALGATPGSVSRLVAGRVFRWIMTGAAAGLLLSMAGARSLRSLLYGVPTTDLTAWMIALAALIVTGSVATWFPARRAARVDPASVLRTE